MESWTDKEMASTESQSQGELYAQTELGLFTKLPVIQNEWVQKVVKKKKKKQLKDQNVGFLWQGKNGAEPMLLPGNTRVKILHRFVPGPVVDMRSVHIDWR